jgi:hypothetical protein
MNDPGISTHSRTDSSRGAPGQRLARVRDAQCVRLASCQLPLSHVRRAGERHLSKAAV